MRSRGFLAIILVFSLSTGAAVFGAFRGAPDAPATYLSAQEGRDKRQQPEMVMDVLGIQPGMTIGEVGAGHGYFTFKLSRRVGPEGRIYANDIDRHALERIEERAKKEDVDNIVTVLGEV